MHGGVLTTPRGRYATRTLPWTARTDALGSETLQGRHAYAVLLVPFALPASSAAQVTPVVAVRRVLGPEVRGW
jgi:hypothetical protein